MMSLSETFNYLEYSDWDCKILELPYQDDKASMVILLPNAKDGLGRLEEAVTMETLNAALDQMRPESIDLRLPKFKLEQSIDLKDHLEALGIVDLFDANVADLSGISGKKGLVVSGAIHKSYVNVNEKGTKAAGATDVGFTYLSGKFYQIFVVDRPFMFCLRDKQTGSILFMGRLLTPPPPEDTADAAVTSFPAICPSFILLFTLVALFLS